MQVHVGEEPPSFERYLLIHVLVVVDLALLFPGLTQFNVDFVFLLLAQGQLLVDVRLQRIVRDLDLMLPLLKLLRLVQVHPLGIALVEEFLFLFFDLKKLRLERFNGLSQALLIFF